MQLRLATRIHYALLRYLGTGIDVGSMLSRKPYAREVIFVCIGCSDPELNALGREFIEVRKVARDAGAPLAEERKRVPATIPMLPVTAVVPIQPDWAPDTSGFGFGSSQQAQTQVEAPPEPVAGPARKRWFDPARWLRRSEPDEPSS